MSAPVYGCEGCRTTLGALGCPTHGQLRKAADTVRVGPSEPSHRLPAELPFSVRPAAEPKEDAVREPRTAAGKALVRNVVTSKGGAANVVTLVLAIEDQAATEARRELLAEVEKLENESPDLYEARGWKRHRAAVIRLIEERP